MISQQTSGGSLSAIGFLGNTVTTKGDTATHQSGTSSTWNLTASKAGTATLKVTDANGTLVRTINQSVTTGTQAITWDGRNDSGVIQPSGTYKISASGNDSSGTPLTLSTGKTGVVSGIDFTGTEPLLTVNGEQVKLSQIASVSAL
jgi:flagellar basal-body rod modification protein FlgD